MLPKSQIKLITSLSLKKHRHERKLFIAEGIKTVTELLASRIQLEHLYSTNPDDITSSNNHTLITEKELQKISALKTPNQVLGIFKIPAPKDIDLKTLIVAVDALSDPGNLGTIIRLCDWFGIKDLLCSLHTVDCFNSKVVQASMGSMARVNISYLDLETFLAANQDKSIFGTFMNGDNIYDMDLPESGIVVLGNEANGISSAIEKVINRRIAIPRFGALKATESLNVATATAIVLSEFKRASTEK